MIHNLRFNKKILHCAILVFALFTFSFENALSKVLETNPDQIERIRILSPNNVPIKILVVHAGKNNSKFVSKLSKIIIDINENENLDPSEKIKVHILTGDTAETRLVLEKAGITEKLRKKYVEINDNSKSSDVSFSGDDLWMQDWGEVATVTFKDNPEPKLLVMDSNRQRGIGKLPAVLAKFWNCYYLKNPSEKLSAGDYGGNIEATPDDVLVLGSTSTDELRKMFEKFGYSDRVIVVDTDWLAVGHCDEYLSFVPTTKSPSGYAIFVADPELALNLIKNTTVATLEKTTDVRYSYIITEINKILNNQPHEDTGEVSETAKAVIEKNKLIHVIIDKNVNDVMKKINEVRKTPDGLHYIIPIPTIFYQSQNGKSVAYHPGSVNMLIIRDYLIIPDPMIKPFKDYIRKVAKKLALHPYFVKDMFYHNRMGEIHCGTNVLRHPNRYIVPPEYLPEHYKKFMKKYEQYKKLQDYSKPKNK
jgi:hypothetical protein